MLPAALRPARFLADIYCNHGVSQSGSGFAEIGLRTADSDTGSDMEDLFPYSRDEYVRRHRRLPRARDAHP